MKKKILIFGIPKNLFKHMKEDALKALASKYDIIMTDIMRFALRDLSYAAIAEKNPVQAVLFFPSALSQVLWQCNAIDQLAVTFNKKALPISMIFGSEGETAKENAISSMSTKGPIYAKSWEEVTEIVLENVK